MNPWTIVFDLDGTLVDTAPDLLVALNRALEGAGFDPVSIQVLRPAMSYGARRMVELGLAAQPADKQQAMCGSGQIDALTQVLLAHYKNNYAMESRLYPHVREVLQALTDEGAIIAVCTNKSEDLSRQLLKTLDLTHYFSAICGKETFAVSKPHPDHLIKTVEAASGRINWSVMIGDSDVDIKTALAAQVPVIGVSHGYSPLPLETYGPDIVINHFGEFFEALDSLTKMDRLAFPGARQFSD
jgi:phosphoglycolate phosphatase